MDAFDEPDTCCPHCGEEAGTKINRQKGWNYYVANVRVCAACNGELQNGHFAPSEEQIRRRMAAIRKTWSRRERRARSAFTESARVELPVIPMPKGNKKNLGDLRQ